MNIGHMKKFAFRHNIAPVLLTVIITIILLSCTGTYSGPSNEPGFRDRKQSELWHYARTFLGTPYRYGGISNSGMDCSGLVVRLFKDIYGLHLPHRTADLYHKGKNVSIRALTVGDLLFFRENRGSRPSHVGVYMGNNSFIHTSTSKGVILSSLKNKYYKNRYIGARRVN